MADDSYIVAAQGCEPDLEGYPCSFTVEELKAINNLFQHYIFKRREKGERNTVRLWTSCCHREAAPYALLHELMTGDMVQFATAKHNDEVTCPFCGEHATLKELGRIGKAKSLEECIAVIVLKAGEKGELYANGFWAWKGYNYFRRGEHVRDETVFSLEPLFRFTACYKFEPGRATMHERGYENQWKTVVETLARPRGRKKITEPCMKGGGIYLQYVGYYVIGFSEIEKSVFKYCQYDRFHGHSNERYTRLHFALMRYLAAASLYPKAVEMLMRGGMAGLVTDLVYSRKKNADLINWEEPDPRKAFGLDGQEMSAWRTQAKMDSDVLRLYKYFRKKKTPVSFEDARTLESKLHEYATTEFMKRCGLYHIKPMRLFAYLERCCAANCFHSGTNWTMDHTFRIWRDYIDAAATLKYDLSFEPVLMPKALMQAHDTAVDEVNRRREEARRIAAAEERAREAEERAKREAERKVMEAQERKRAVKLKKRCAFAYGGYLIRPACTSEEIVAEGVALKHCVGGYAGRHMEGKLVICFLRLAAEPDKPLVTIELSTKGKFVQAHGFANDRGQPPAIETYGNIIGPWLTWIENGSKRDKDGNPVLDKPGKEEGTVHAA